MRIFLRYFSIPYHVEWILILRPSGWSDGVKNIQRERAWNSLPEQTTYDFLQLLSTCKSSIFTLIFVSFSRLYEVTFT